MSEHISENRDASLNEPVLVYDAGTPEEAEVVVATLSAAGIPATLRRAAPLMGAADGLMDSSTYNTGVCVAEADVEAARAVLAAPPMTEEELIAAEEAEPMTLEEAEERARNA